jgi:hypothetical protein
MDGSFSHAEIVVDFLWMMIVLSFAGRSLNDSQLERLKLGVSDDRVPILWKCLIRRLTAGIVRASERILTEPLGITAKPGDLADFDHVSFRPSCS